MKYFFFIFILLLGACVQEIPFPEKSSPPKLVLGCLFNTDSLFKVHISKTQGIFDTTKNYVANARVELWQNKQLIEILQHIKKGLYMGTSRASINTAYTLKVSAPGFISVEASDIIPEKQSILNAELKANAGWDYLYLSNYHTINISFTNNIKQNLYFENILVFNSWVPRGLVYPDDNWEDSLLYNSIIPYIKSNDIFIQSENYDFDAVSFINSLVFTNELVKGDNINMLVKFSSSNTITGYGLQLVVYLKTISNNYYLYKTTLRKHIKNQGMTEPASMEDYSELLFTGLPADVYSNVKNGYGIFAGCSLDTVSIAVKSSDFH